MALDRTHQYRPLITDDATLQQMHDTVDNINDLKDDAVDSSDGNINASIVTIDADATVSGDRSLIFKLTGPTSRVLKFKNSTGRMRLENQAAALVGLEVADAAQLTEAATLGQLTTAKLKTVVGKSANYKLVAGDIGAIISATSTFTLSFDPAATLGNGIITVGRQRSGLILLDVQSPSNVTTVDFTKFITADFNEFLFHCPYALPVTDGVDAHLLFSTDGGSTYLGGTIYKYRQIDQGLNVGASTGDSKLKLNRINVGNVDGEGIDFQLSLRLPSGSQALKSAAWDYNSRDPSGGIAAGDGWGQILTSSAINAMRFQFSGGNVSTGILKLYGVR